MTSAYSPKPQLHTSCLMVRKRLQNVIGRTTSQLEVNVVMTGASDLKIAISAMIVSENCARTSMRVLVTELVAVLRTLPTTLRRRSVSAMLSTISMNTRTLVLDATGTVTSVRPITTKTAQSVCLVRGYCLIVQPAQISAPLALHGLAPVPTNPALRQRTQSKRFSM
jgi:hypothetical protein